MAGLANKCKNCGADLDPAMQKCAYCGTGYNSPKAPVDIIQANSSTTEANSTVSLGAVAAIFIVILVVVIITVFDSRSNKSHNAHNSAYSENTARETEKDTTPKIIDGLASARVEVSSEDRVFLQALTPVKIDVQGFRKLYRRARKIPGNFSGSTFIADRTSPWDKKVTTIYLYITKVESFYTPYLYVQYASAKWLLLYDATFLFDGKSYKCDLQFDRERGRGKTWESSSHNILPDDVAMLIKFAAAKKASIKYVGELGSVNVDITPEQQTALKRQLQIYKGLIIGYDKPE